MRTARPALARASQPPVFTRRTLARALLYLPADWRMEVPMLDALMVASTLAFFAVAWLFARACDRL